MNKAPISVVITTYNDSHYLKEAIDSIFNQSLLPEQIILVDDGSASNKASDIAENYITNKYGIEFIFLKTNNKGPSSARNQGIKIANKKFITFLDADDKMLNNNLYDKFQLITTLSDEYFGVYGSGRSSEAYNQDFLDFDGVANPESVGVFNNGVPGGAYFYLFRLKHLMEINGFDEELVNNEDIDLLIRLSKNGKLCRGTVGYTNFHRIRKTSLSRGGNHKRRLDNVMKFLDKAEKNDYFSNEELLRRKKVAHLIFFHKIFIKHPFKSVGYIEKAFSYSKPKGWKQRLVFSLSKASSAFRKNSKIENETL